MFAKISKNFREIQLEAEYLRNGCCPDFVVSRSPQPLQNEIPIFMLHSIHPDILERQLKFLSENGYQSIDCESFYRILTKQEPPPQKAVLLTIDDGKSSVWTYGCPLLKKYNFKATVFLIPGYMQDDGEYRFNLEDYWKGKCSRDAVKSFDDHPTNPLLTWRQAREMHDAGVIDFQSHTLYHHKIYTSAKIVDFFSPRHRTPIFNLVVPKDFENVVKSGKTSSLYGMPIYEHESLMSSKPRYLNNDEITQDCLSFVQNNGGVEFFDRASWKAELEKLALAKASQNTEGAGRFQTEKEQAEEILSNLETCKRIIEEKIPGTEARHLCYPYGIGSEMAVECSKRAGYVANYWVIHPSRSINRPGDDPFYCCRLKDDYIERLPGSGRKSLASIFLFKLKRRLSGKPIY